VPALPRKPRILVLNQYYWPGVEATANLLTELCEALAEDNDVEVVTGMLHGHEGEPRESERNAVRIVRVSSTAYDRSRLGRRAVNYVSYLGSTLAYALKQPAPDLVLCMTDPPIIGDLGVLVGRRVGAPVLVISQDVFPEIATELHRLRNPAVVGVLRALVAAYLRRADRIVAIGETMRRRLEAKGAPPERLRVIPNWVDTRAITPQPRDNAWAAQHDLVSRFVVMHSGNVGHAQDLDSLVRAATVLRDRDDVPYMIAGFGPGVSKPFSVGDKVVALLSGGGYAEQVAVPAGQVLRIPDGVDLVTAASLPEVAATVYSNLVMTAQLQPGEAQQIAAQGHQVSREIGRSVVRRDRSRHVARHLSVGYGNSPSRDFDTSCWALSITRRW